MKSVDRQKMCVNCDGRVPFEAIICPYCSADLSRTPEVELRQDPLTRNQAIQDSLTSLYTPPYKGKRVEAPKIAAKEPRMTPPGHQQGGTAHTSGSLQNNEEQEKVGKDILFSILSLSLGSMLFIVGLLQIFLSDGGVLRLEWDTHHRFIYALASLPLLYFGYRKAEQSHSR